MGIDKGMREIGGEQNSNQNVLHTCMKLPKNKFN